MLNKNLIKILSLGFGLFLAACGSPKDEFKKVIKDEGYIPYNTPLESAGVGTIIQGKPSAMHVATRPERCFPNRSPEGNETGLRWMTKTNLPSVYKDFKVDFGVDLSDILTPGNPLVNLNLSYSRAKKVEVKFDGASIEYLDEFNFYYYYNLLMTDYCKDLLKSSPFIVQALQIEKMSFKFYEANGVGIELSPGMLGDVMKIGTGVNWKIENTYELVIDTPKYIGYQVGFMDADTPGKIGFLANELKGDAYKYVQIDQVPVPETSNKTVDKLSKK